MSGNSRSKRKEAQWIRMLKAKYPSIQVNQSSGQEETIGFLDTISQHEQSHIIISGGDGSLHYWINQILKHQPALLKKVGFAVYPSGTGNDWATANNYSDKPKDWIDSMQKTALKKVPCAAIKYHKDEEIRQTYFVNVAGAGLDGMIVKRMQKGSKNNRWSYLYNSILSLLSHPSWQVELSVDNQTKRIQANMILAGLSSTFGGGLKLTPHCKPGVMAVSVFSNLKFWDIFRYIPNIFNGRLERIPKVACYHARRLSIGKIKSKHPLFVEADGEYVGAQDVWFEMSDYRFDFFVPRS